MWAIPTGASRLLKKKIQVKSSSIWSRVPETGSDPPIGSDRDSGCDNRGIQCIVMPRRPNWDTF